MSTPRYTRRHVDPNDVRWYGVWTADRKLGIVVQRRHQSRRTHAVGWRWFSECSECDVLLGSTGHGYETRLRAGHQLIYHWNEKHGTSLEDPR